MLVLAETQTLFGINSAACVATTSKRISRFEQSGHRVGFGGDVILSRRCPLWIDYRCQTLLGARQGHRRRGLPAADDDPQPHFHIAMAYAILRHKGVDVGKMDFLGPINLVDA